MYTCFVLLDTYVHLITNRRVCRYLVHAVKYKLVIELELEIDIHLDLLFWFTAWKLVGPIYVIIIYYPDHGHEDEISSYRVFEIGYWKTFNVIWV